MVSKWSPDMSYLNYKLYTFQVRSFMFITEKTAKNQEHILIRRENHTNALGFLSNIDLLMSN